MDIQDLYDLTGLRADQEMPSTLVLRISARVGIPDDGHDVYLKLLDDTLSVDGVLRLDLVIEQISTSETGSPKNRLLEFILYGPPAFHTVEIHHQGSMRTTFPVNRNQ